MYVHLITHTVRYIEKCFICQMRSDILQSFIKILPNRLLQKLIKKKKEVLLKRMSGSCISGMYVHFQQKWFPPQSIVYVLEHIYLLWRQKLCASIRSSGAQDFSMLSYLVDLYCCLRAVSSFTRSE